MYRVLSCVFNNLIDNYVCIEYMSCQSETLSAISCNPKFMETIFNILLGIGISELLRNLVSCHGFMKKPNSTVTLNFRNRLVKSYLSKGLSIIEWNKK